MDELPLTPETAVSAIDGRYAKITEVLRNYFSEYALQKNRTKMEIEFLIYLSENPEITHVRKIDDEEKEFLKKIYQNFDLGSMNEIKKQEKKTNHDVKSVEYFIREEIKGTSLEDLSESIHFSLTSEDCTNIAYAMALNDVLDEVFVPKLNQVISKLAELTETYAETPMLARTHGQPASPTTVGKEFGNLASELLRKLERMIDFQIPAKLNGATGNYNALKAAYPEIEGMDFSWNFIEGLGLLPKLYTTQVDGYTEYSELFNLFKETNTFMKKIDRDMWMYISYENFVQKRKEGEVGSSTMPHKVNPIQFENSEGNTIIANAIFEGLNHLPETRMQRDLSGSTMLRAMGEAFSHTLIDWENTIKGLNRVEPNIPHLEAELEAHQEILAEPIQQILRREGISGAYEKMKDLTRGKKVSKGDFVYFVNGLELKSNVKGELLDLIEKGPKAYIGDAPKIAREILKEIRDIQSVIN